MSESDESSRPSDRFLARPSPQQGRNRVVVETDLSSSPHQPAIREKSIKTRTRKSRVKAAFAAANSLNGIEDGRDCQNPFDCPPKFVAAGRRPRVKSNLQARKRNFWQKTKVAANGSGKLKLGEFGVGHQGGRRRKIRRGRKQRPRQSFGSEEETELANLINDGEDFSQTTEQFVPTTRTTTTTSTTTPTTPTTTTTTSTLAREEEENEIFDDFFDHQNDFFAASSTISPVVFKGSPGPGFFSSPQPFFGSDGHQVGHCEVARSRKSRSNLSQPFQVSFTSPSPFGHGPAGRRPSFNNIGAHIDLGPTKPQKILNPESLLFISSTVSNKIVIGSEEEITTTAAPAPTETEKTEPALIDLSPGRNFPSFPIRGDDSPSIKPKLDFSRRNKATFKFGKSTPVNEEAEEEREENVTEQNEFSSTAKQVPTTTTTTTPAETPSKNQFVVTKSQPRGKFPRVKSNLLFNRKNKERFRLKLAQLSGRKSTTATATSTSSTTTSDPTLNPTSSPPADIPAPTKGSLFSPRKKFNLRKKQQSFFKVPNVSITNSLLKFRNRAKFNSQTETEETDARETTVAGEVSTESVLSVEAELEEEEERKPSVQLGDPVDHVRKAQQAPPNGNIRVEFKKKTAELTGNRGRFFINPDGRKPRVKSNIRAHLANRGHHFAGQHQAEDSVETFDGASSQLDLTPFNNIKREVDNAEAPGEVDVLSNHNQIIEPEPTKPVPTKPVPTKPIKPVKPLTFALPLLPLEPVILNPRQASRSNNNNKKPPLPPAILKHINHITDIRSLPPLPPNINLSLPKRPTKATPVLEARIFAEEAGARQGGQTGLLDQIVVESPASPSPLREETPGQALPTAPFTTAGAGNKLSAFRALQQQVERREEVNSSQQEPSPLSLV